MSDSKRKFFASVIAFGTIAGLLGYATASSTADQNGKLFVLFVLYGILAKAFTEICWHYFERRQLTMIFDAKSMNEMKMVDSEKLWNKIKQRMEEEDDESQTPST